METISFAFLLRVNTLNFVCVSESSDEVLGFEQHEILQLRLTDLLDDEEQEDVIDALNVAVRENKAASILYLQLLHARQRRFMVCQMAFSIAGNVIVGSIYVAPLATIGSTPRDRSAEDVIVAAIDHIDHPGIVGYPAINWTGTRFPRTALLLDRFAVDCTITHCSNNAILDNETCILQPFYRYVAARDEDTVRSFISSMKRDTSMNVGFVYHTFAMCPAGRDLRASSAQTVLNAVDEVRVSAVGIASSDCLIVVLKLES